jgi:hypothetical protein
MATAVYFHGMSCIDFQDLRRNAIRIPEVLSRIRQAQRVIDGSSPTEFDLLNFLASDDAVFLANIRLKGLAAAVVQVGLFDRYLKRQGTPDFLIGDIKGDSAALCCSGFLTFDDLVRRSRAFVESAAVPVAAVGEPLLAGISLSELAVFGRDPETGMAHRLERSAASVTEAMRLLVDEFEVRRFVNIGPGSVFETLRRDYSMEDLQFIESVDLDPMLNWFWTDIPRENASLPL